jgi:hypothetical protein
MSGFEEHLQCRSSLGVALRSTPTDMSVLVITRTHSLPVLGRHLPSFRTLLSRGVHEAGRSSMTMIDISFDHSVYVGIPGKI